jgi:hypothetical protein
MKPSRDMLTAKNTLLVGVWVDAMAGLPRIECNT